MKRAIRVPLTQRNDCTGEFHMAIENKFRHVKSENTTSFLSSISFITLLFICVTLSSQTEIGSNWRGPERNGIYLETNLLKEWGENGPKMLWSYERIGNGHSSVAINGNNIFVSGMIDSTGYLYKFDKTGKLLWEKGYGLEWQYNWPGTRSTPVIYKNNIYIFSGRGEVICLNEQTGNKIWSLNILETTDGKNIKFGITENMLIVDDKVICVPGGKTTNVLALDYETGEIIWKSEGKREPSAYSSPQLLSLKSGNQIITHTSKSLIALDPASGKLIWSYPHKHSRPTNPNTPVYHDGEIFCVSGYGMSSQKLKLINNGLNVEQVWKCDSLDNKMGGVVLVNGYLYGSGDFKRGWKCIDWRTGEMKYNSTELKGNGVTIFADGMLYCYSDKGVIALVKPNPEKFEIISRFNVPLGKNQHWAHPVIDDGKLYVRHGNALMVYNIRVK